MKSAQQKLKTLVPELTTDGRYGASTREAVLAWQVVHDLKPDGMLGRATWNSLYGVTTRKSITNAKQHPHGGPRAGGHHTDAVIS